MIKLQDVNDKVYFDFRKAQVKAMEIPRLGKIHVSDVIKPCMRNVIYKKTLPHTGMTTEDMRSLYLGQAIHNASQVAELENHEMFLGYNYVRDEVVTLDEAKKIPEDDPRHLDIIYGSLDDLVKVGQEWVICDKKTTGSIDYFSRYNSKPSESHVDQINCYRVLLKKCYDIDATFGCIIYLSNGIDKEKRDKPVVMSFKLKPIDETLEKIIKQGRIIKASLTKKILPERTKCFLCDGMCPYATKCFTEESDTFA